MSYFGAYRSKLIHLLYDHAVLAFEWAMIRFGMALDRAIWAGDAALDRAFNPNQPRVPAGSPDGGQWTGGDDTDTLIIDDPPIEKVYPELLILPFLRIPRILNAWRVWAPRQRESREWTLGKFKSAKRRANQMESRNWTPEDITETIREGEKLAFGGVPSGAIDDDDGVSTICLVHSCDRRDKHLPHRRFRQETR